MNPVTASVTTVYTEGHRLIVTDYVALCGCVWRVDMWGNTKSVKVCRACLQTPLEWENQLQLFSPEAGP